MSLSTNEKIAQLRAKMEEVNVQAYIVPTSDPHMSEYNAVHYEARHWLTGFTGSAGTALVTQDDAKLWADGRYFIQAENQIKGSLFELMKLATPGFPSLVDFLTENLEAGDTVAINGEVVSQKQVEGYEKAFAKKGIKLAVEHQLVSEIWENQPALPDAMAFLLDEKWSGRKTEDKIAALRENLEKNEEDYALIGRLDDVAWLYNIRGNDIEFNPVAYAYALVSQDEARLFVDLNKLTPEINEELEAQGVSISDYADIFSAVSELSDKTVHLDKSAINSLVFSHLPESANVVDGRDWTLLEKAKKNDTEIKNQYEAYRLDGLAVTKLMYWVAQQEDLSQYDEMDIDRLSRSLREELDSFIDLSFGTIAAYGPNAAMAHYSATEDNKAQLENKGFLLVDSGGQYWEGTTDTTRTFAVGELTNEEIKDYTLTLKSHVNLARAVFLEGSTGYQLDMLARAPMWENHMDYKHGTGHGIGYLLNVHEGPQSISGGKSNQTVMEIGMITSNEPGVYKEGKHGVRLESVVVTVEDALVGTDRFLKFDTMTRVPMDRRAIDKSLLSEEDIAWIDEYHKTVFEDLKGDLSEAEASWLEEMCKPL